jgi:hypothetical protein
MEEKANILRDPHATTRTNNMGNEPMDLDHVQQITNQQQHKSRNRRRYQQQPSTNPSNSNSGIQRRAYDKDGNPICDFCSGKHRTIDCYSKKNPFRSNNSNKSYGQRNRQRQTNIHHIDWEPTQQEDQSVQQQDNNVNSTSADVSHIVRETNKPLPSTEICINDITVPILWDSGPAITGISTQLAQQLQLSVDNSETIMYRDVNIAVNETIGTVSLHPYNYTVKAHVISGLPKPLVIGWDTITHMDATLDATNNSITKNSKDQPVSISFKSPANDMKHIEQQSQQKQIITDRILEKYDSVIAKNPDRPTVTNKATFEIDTGNSPPVYIPPRKYHPDIQAEIDTKLQQMVSDGILSPVTFTRWGSPVRPVTKPDGSMRVCGNYIALNKVTLPTKYPFPNLHETLQSLGQAKVFFKLDLDSGYYQIPILESH